MRTEPRILRRQPRTARRNELHFAGRVQVAVARQELVRLCHSIRSRAPRSTRAWLQVISDIPAVEKTTGVALPSAPAQGKTLKSVRRLTVRRRAPCERAKVCPNCPLQRIGGRTVVALTVRPSWYRFSGTNAKCLYGPCRSLGRTKIRTLKTLVTYVVHVQAR